MEIGFEESVEKMKLEVLGMFVKDGNLYAWDDVKGGELPVEEVKKTAKKKFYF